MRIPLIRNEIGRLALTLSLLVLAACGTEHAGMIPSGNMADVRPRVVSTDVSAGGRSYTIDEIYSPSESNLEAIAPGPRGHIYFTGDSLVGKSSVKSDMSEDFLPVDGNPNSIVEGPDQNLWLTLYDSVGRITANGRFTDFPIPRKLGGVKSGAFSIARDRKSVV